MTDDNLSLNEFSVGRHKKSEEAKVTGISIANKANKGDFRIKSTHAVNTDAAHASHAPLDSENNVVNAQAKYIENHIAEDSFLLPFLESAHNRIAIGQIRAMKPPKWFLFMKQATGDP